jgi:predicted nucleic acid-binding protein
LIYAFESRGPERSRLVELVGQAAEIEVSSVAWYEYARGPRTPQQLAVARSCFGATGIVGFAEAIAQRAADVFRQLGSPRRRAADIAIGVTAATSRARLLTRNRRDFDGIPELDVEVVGATGPTRRR